MQNLYTLLTAFSSFVVFPVTPITGQPPQYNCTEGCYRCTAEHLTLNGTTKWYANALCNFRSGVKLTGIPQLLPLELGTLRISSHNIRELKTTSLENYQYLYRLYLDKNSLRRIEDGSFRRQHFLNLLDLSENKLVNLSADSFQGLNTLQFLQLDHNKLERISGGMFDSVPSLKELDLQENSISVLEKGAFEGLDYLQKLSLSSNKLLAIDSGAFGNLMSLKQVELASNQIRTIAGDAFSCAPLVNKLMLKHNNLDRVPKAIGHLRFLDFLDISENSAMNFIESDAFIGLESIATIDLRDCNISSIQNGSFNDLAKIAAVYFHNNPLNCDCHLSWLPKWLSGNPEVTFKGAVCQVPSDISGKILTAANLSSFICSCPTCTNDAACSLVPTNCTCSSENWVGSSCSETCQSKDTSVNNCRSFGGNCFCERNASQQRQKAANCSFSITSEKCSEDGELKKFGSHLRCECKWGFYGNGTHCNDIDECKTGEAVCSVHADCVNTPGSYYCKCHQGFEEENSHIPQLMTCKDIDECTEQTPCDAHAKCHNNPGSYTCTCVKGFTGDGVRCYPVPDKPTDLRVTEIHPTQVSVTWNVVNTSIVRELRVEYKGLGIHGKEWEIKAIQPDETKTDLKDLVPDSTYIVRVGAFSIYNTSRYSNERSFKTSPVATPSATDRTAGSKSKNIVVIAVALVVSLALLVIIAAVLYCLMRRKKKQKKNSNTQYVPGLEDLIEMRTRTHSGGAESRGNRDPLELGSFTSYAVDYTDEWEIPRDRLVTGQKVGEGQFGMVLEGTLMTDDGLIKVAVKTIKEHADRFDYKDLLQEMEMMKEIGQHPHVVSLVGTCTTPGPLYIITEYVSGGNLLDYLRASRPDDETYVNIISTLSSRDLLKIALDCARGMHHIAEKKFVHRDLAARNILLTEEHEAKVADFGLARDIYGDGQYVKTGGGRVPIKWMAPESIQDQIYTTRSDVWSFGILLWEIITIGGSPYPCVPVNLLLTKLLCGYRMSKPAHCSDELYDLMKTCWQLDPKERPTFSEICCTLSEMLSESARSYVNITLSEEQVGPEEELLDDAHKQTTSV